jgi:hypothetical protein
MRIVLLLSAVLLVTGYAAHAQETVVLGSGMVHGAHGEAVHYEAGRYMSWHSPFYYGRGESHMTHACCPNPYPCHLDLWDDYCYERVRCVGCGHRSGRLARFLRWEGRRGRCAGGCGERCSCSAGQPAAYPDSEAAESHEAKPLVPPPSVPKVPSAGQQTRVKLGAKKKTAPGKQAPRTMKIGYQLFDSLRPTGKK